MVFNMQMAKLYNHHTGANITHHDVEEWGFMEMTYILNAFDLLAAAK